MQKLLKPGFLALLILMLGLTACDPLGIRGKGGLTNETRQVDEFDEINVSVPGHIELRKGPEYRIDIQIEESLVPYLETEVRNGRLDVYFSRNVYDVDDLELVITAPDFNEIEVNGSGDLVAIDSLNGDQLRLDVSGSGNILMKHVNFGTIITNTSGSGNMTIRGVADHLDANVSGSGDVEATDCPVLTADLTISGSGTIRCDVSEHLKANISGSGTVWYEGTPTLDVNISGSGRVKKL